MIPNSIQYFLGYNSLSLMMSQERKHWLMKTEKMKENYDPETGQSYVGRVENEGSKITVESEKLSTVYSTLSSTKFVDSNANDVFKIYPSAFPYCSEVNGLMFARIESINYPIGSSYKTYKIKFSNCEECIIPFAISGNQVVAGKWIKTTTPPTALLIQDGEYTIERPLNITGTDCVFYYPLNENMQVSDLTQDGSTYTTDPFTDEEGAVGYPAFWFTTKESDIGPTLHIKDNDTVNGKIFHVSNTLDASNKYYAKIYTCVDGDNDCTPDGSSTSDYNIAVYAMNNDFTGAASDFNKNIGKVYLNKIGEKTLIDLGRRVNDIITMTPNAAWEYVNDDQRGYYTIPMDTFNGNCYKNYQNPLTSIFDIHFDESISFEDSINNTGYTGIKLLSSDDNDSRFPYGLDQWDGLPEWITTDVGTSERLAVYAIHNTKGYDPTVPNSRQVAALLFDPGKLKDDDIEDLTNDQRGRVYLLSNDPAEYENNDTTEHPKPARTLARVCDIPTGITQLMDISGIAPTLVVDKKYIRSQASYTEEAQNRLYNKVGNRWVKPTDKDSRGIQINAPAFGENYERNSFVFTSVENLNAVDLENHNDYRYKWNLNPYVPKENVSVYEISNGGSGYQEGDIGVIIVGGASFQYVVNAVDSSGSIEEVSISTEFDSINKSNFNMSSAESSITEVYGSSPTTGEGTGLKLRFDIGDIDDYEVKRGMVYEDIFALVKLKDGFYLYGYYIDDDVRDPEVYVRGAWTQQTKISDFESPSDNTKLNTSDSIMINSITTTRDISALSRSNNDIMLKANASPTYINITDEDYTPIRDTSLDDADDTIAELCHIRCDGVFTAATTMDYKGNESVIHYLKSKGLARYDSYVFWRWLTNDPNDFRFEYFTLYRGLNNNLTDDNMSMLPDNKLLIKKYVNSNPKTTVTWSVKEFGQMVWVYNPKCTTIEEYFYDPSSRDIEIYRQPMPMSDGNYTFNVPDATSETGWREIKVCDNNGIMLYNVLSNNVYNTGFTKDSDDPIYMQPDYVNIISAGSNVRDIDTNNVMMGNWQLVYPRVHTYKLQNTSTQVEYGAVNMTAIKLSGVMTANDIVDEFNKPINGKALVIESNNNGIHFKAYNEVTETWEEVK